MEELIAVSFFTGAGGLDMGIEEAGFNIKLCVEIEKKYCETLRLNHPHWNIQNGDIMDYDKDRVYKEAKINENKQIDLIIGGSPCQSFSTAGKRQAFEDVRGKAMIKYIEVIEEIRPKVFLLENVKGLLSAALKHRKLSERGNNFPKLKEEEKPGSAFNYLINKLESYDVKYEIINSADYGVPQKRERVVIVGVRKDLEKEFLYPKKTHSRGGDLNTKKWVSFSHIIEELNNKVKKHDHVEYSQERLKYMQLIPKGGGNWRDLPEHIAKKAMGGAYNSGGGRVGFFRRIKLNEPSPTILTSPMQKSTNLGHPIEDRPLSIQEYLAIQGFPLNYQINGTLNDKYIQVGNAVPVKLAFVMGCAIRDLLMK